MSAYLNNKEIVAHYSECISVSISAIAINYICYQWTVFVAPALAGRHRRASFRPFVRPSVHPSTFNMGIL